MFDNSHKIMEITKASQRYKINATYAGRENNVKGNSIGTV